MSNAQVKASIAGYLTRFFPGYALKDEEDIFSLGFVNSMFAMQLVQFVEHEFQVTVESEDLELKNFSSINALSDFVARKRLEAVG